MSLVVDAVKLRTLLCGYATLIEQLRGHALPAADEVENLADKIIADLIVIGGPAPWEDAP